VVRVGVPEPASLLMAPVLPPILPPALAFPLPRLEPPIVPPPVDRDPAPDHRDRPDRGRPDQINRTRSD
jgi:hypothetical protein